MFAKYILLFEDGTLFLMHFTNLLRFNNNRRISAANKSKETKTRQSLDIQFSFPDLQINPCLNLKTAEHNEEGIQ